MSVKPIRKHSSCVACIEAEKSAKKYRTSLDVMSDVGAALACGFVITVVFVYMFPQPTVTMILVLWASMSCATLALTMLFRERWTYHFLMEEHDAYIYHKHYANPRSYDEYQRNGRWTSTNYVLRQGMSVLLPSHVKFPKAQFRMVGVKRYGRVIIRFYDGSWQLTVTPMEALAIALILEGDVGDVAGTYIRYFTEQAESRKVAEVAENLAVTAMAVQLLTSREGEYSLIRRSSAGQALHTFVTNRLAVDAELTKSSLLVAVARERAREVIESQHRKGG